MCQGPWMNWSIFWNCPNPSTAPPLDLLASNSTPRLIPWTCGLFDTGLTGAVDPKLCPVNYKIEGPTSSTPNATDLFLALEKGSDMQLGADCSDLANLDTFDDPSLLGDDSFCEVFTDLSDYLLGTGNMDDLDVVMAPVTEPSTSEAAEVSEGSKPMKRTASTAELDVVEPLPPNPDHNDYISKAKRPRMASSVTSMASVDMTSEDEADLNGKPRTKDEKYVERRRKNNIASRRSRETRKEKFTKMEEQAIELEKSNELLRQKMVELERLTKQMKETLVERLAKRK